VRVGLKPKQIKYLNSTAARLQPNEKEEMGSSGVQLQDAEACRSEAGDEENEQVVEPNEKEKQDSGRDHPYYLRSRRRRRREASPLAKASAKQEKASETLEVKFLLRL